MEEGIRKAKDFLCDIKEKEQVKVISHIDADGISAAAVMSNALERLGINHYVECISLDKIKSVSLEKNTIFLDMGSGQKELIARRRNNEKILVLDHHQGDFIEDEGILEFNPMMYGKDGSLEISGAGVTYIIAKALDSSYKDLSKIALIGAIGDQQSSFGGLKGMNIEILKDAKDLGLIEVQRDLMLYGRETRPLYKSLEYFSDPPIPGITGNEDKAKKFLYSLGIKTHKDLETGGGWSTIASITKEEKKKIVTELIKRIIPEIPKSMVKYVPDMIVGDSYTLTEEKEGSPLRDISEFSTCLNACGRNDKPLVGYLVAKGDRDRYVKELFSLLRQHRMNIARGISMMERRGIRRKGNLQYFNGIGLSESIVGTVASMILGTNGTNYLLPIMGYTTMEDNKGYKVSVRCSKLLVLNGINLGKAIKTTAKNCGGTGGGHSPACGGYIPEGKMDKFIEEYELEIVKQNALF